MGPTWAKDFPAPVLLSLLFSECGDHPRTAVVTGQQGQQLSLCRPEKQRWWSPQHPLPTPPAGPRAAQNRTQGKGRRRTNAPFRHPPWRSPKGNALCPAQLLSGCPRRLHCPRPLRPAQPCTRLCFGAMDRLHSAETLPRDITPKQAMGLYPSQISPDSHLSCDSSSLHKGRQ